MITTVKRACCNVVVPGWAPPLIRVLVVAIVVVALLLALAWAGQRKLIYFPDRSPPGPAPPGVREVSYRTEDGLRLAAWFVPPAGPAPGHRLRRGSEISLLYRHPGQQKPRGGKLSVSGGDFAALLGKASAGNSTGRRTLDRSRGQTLEPAASTYILIGNRGSSVRWQLSRRRPGSPPTDRGVLSHACRVGSEIHG